MFALYISRQFEGSCASQKGSPKIWDGEDLRKARERPTENLNYLPMTVHGNVLDTVRAAPIATSTYRRGNLLNLSIYNIAKEMQFPGFDI